MKVSDEEWNRIFKKKVEEQFLEEIREEAEARRKGCVLVLIGTIIIWSLVAWAIWG
jgi:uncharacterized protein YjeT (DUF2065 family)